MIRTPREDASTNLPQEKENGNVRQARTEAMWYEIRVRGQLGPEWLDWFEGLAFRYLDEGDMLLSGRIVDQAALLGMLTRLIRLNLALVSVRSFEE